MYILKDRLTLPWVYYLNYENSSYNFPSASILKTIFDGFIMS